MAKNPTVAPRAAVLCLLRHGDAGEPLARPNDDRRRPLTDRGRKQAKRAGRALAALGLLPREVWTSRLLRARETAGIAAKAADARARTVESAAMAPDAGPERTVEALATAGPAARARARRRAAPAHDVRWLVGHEPHLSRLLGHLTGAPPAAFRLGKGAAAVVEFPGGLVAAGAGRLTLLLPPDASKAVGRAR